MLIIAFIEIKGLFGGFCTSQLFPKSKSLFLDVVHIKPPIHHPSRWQDLADITFHEFLHLFWHVAQAQFPHVIIPLDYVDARLRDSVLGNPICNRLVVRASGDKRPERLRVDFGEIEKVSVKWAVKVVLTHRASDGGAAFIEEASR
jgi:hypothetical protein